MTRNVARRLPVPGESGVGRPARQGPPRHIAAGTLVSTTADRVGQGVTGEGALAGNTSRVDGQARLGGARTGAGVSTVIESGAARSQEDRRRAWERGSSW
ncbi:hypothetical protein GCM10022243_09350 [Saccharothrix violaceirubra]|uniref:Uncharacterized protein n=1 Tax=Saccharothrix violaceirubra TaxID=413306 RepID=A0A7W7WWQ2_9PSEU|nr:hypothetical protein [Saccharothrix violaceirubra]